MLNAPAQIPKYKRPVDVLKYANDIVEKARRVERDGSAEKEQPQQQQTPKEKRPSRVQEQVSTEQLHPIKSQPITE